MTTVHNISNAHQSWYRYDDCKSFSCFLTFWCFLWLFLNLKHNFCRYFTKVSSWTITIVVICCILKACRCPYCDLLIILCVFTINKTRILICWYFEVQLPSDQRFDKQIISGHKKGGDVRRWGNGLNRQAPTRLLQHPYLGPPQPCIL